jgi:large subunit ribosomal protein L21
MLEAAIYFRAVAEEQQPWPVPLRLTESVAALSDAPSPARAGICILKVMRAMFAIVRTGGKQYRVAAGDKIVIDKIEGEAGASITLGDVLLAGEGSELKSVEGLTVAAEIIAQAKGDKVIIFKKRRRHNYRRRNGHRQLHTILKITAIGAQEKKAKASKPKATEGDAPAAAEA